MNPGAMVPKHLIVIGTSAGGLDALRQLSAALPRDFSAPICVVMHTSPQSPGVLHQILGRSSRLTAALAEDGERLHAGRIYVAPPDYHVLIEPGRVRVTRGPKENRFRPAIDPLFRSAAQVYGPAAIGVILTGNMDDGTAGLWAIKQLGGTTIVQDPADAPFPSMPINAMQHVRVDHVAPLAGIAPLLVRLTSETAVERDRGEVPEEVEVEVKIAKERNPLDAGLGAIGKPSSFACPECHGVLLQIEEGRRIRFRCHTGHAYSVESLLAAIGEGIEESLWSAVRALEEGSMLMERIAEYMRAHDGDAAADASDLAHRSRDARRQSQAIRTLLTERGPRVPAKS